MKKFLKEFKDFAMRGNVLDMAVGVVVGAAFKAIVDSLVNDIISPLVGLPFKDNFSSLTINVGSGIHYGAFISAVLNFFIVALVLFIVIKAANTTTSLRKKFEHEAPPAAPKTKICPYCCSEIPIEATRCSHCTSVLEKE